MLIGSYFSVAPKIVEMPKNVSVDAPEQWVPFHCHATGRPKPWYHWYHDGEAIALQKSDGNISVVAMRTGKLRCVAENVGGQDSAVVYLHVKRKWKRLFETLIEVDC